MKSATGTLAPPEPRSVVFTLYALVGVVIFLAALSVGMMVYAGLQFAGR